jgi:hypothetical protein
VAPLPNERETEGAEGPDAEGRLRPGEKSIIHSMNDLLRKREEEIGQLCRRHRVKSLSVFGSALGESFDPGTSDVDLLVEFEEMPPRDRAEHFFGLQEDLENLLGLPVDLVEPGPIRNPYFRHAVEASRVLLFEAA